MTIVETFEAPQAPAPADPSTNREHSVVIW
jgi:hypothetical protein